MTIIIITGLIAAFARFAQGNGYAGPGRWLLMATCIIGALVAMQPDSIPMIIVGLWAGVFAGANIAYGYTRWESLPYSLVRYTIPALTAVTPYAMYADRYDAFIYCLVGSALALNQYVLAQHKPAWIRTDKDVATIPAGFMAAVGLMVVL